jgi:hypothetical protein
METLHGFPSRPPPSGCTRPSAAGSRHPAKESPRSPPNEDGCCRLRRLEVQRRRTAAHIHRRNRRPARNRRRVLHKSARTGNHRKMRSWPVSGGGWFSAVVASVSTLPDVTPAHRLRSRPGYRGRSQLCTRRTHRRALPRPSLIAMRSMRPPRSEAARFTTVPSGPTHLDPAGGRSRSS